MRHSRAVSLAIVLCAGTAAAHLHGTYTIKPDSTGDFVDFQSACHLLSDSGIDGDCIFEAYTGYYTFGVGLYGVAGSDTWSIAFRPAPAEHPVIAAGSFECGDVNRVTLEKLTFEWTWLGFTGCREGRILGCRIGPSSDVLFRGCSGFTISGNTIRGLGETDGLLLYSCTDFTVANNFLSLNTPASSIGAFSALNAAGLRLYYNTIWSHSCEDEWQSCVSLDHAPGVDVRNNIVVLGRGCDTCSACIRAWASNPDTLRIDYNCYYVDSVGHVGNWGDSAFLGLAGWQTLGYDAHGLCADPLLSDTTDMHLQPGSPCIRAGVPIPGFTTDIDGEERDPLHPCIGADERAGGSLHEAGLTSVESRQTPEQTILHGVLRRSQASNCELLDASGRTVSELHAGENDVSRFAPGVYFARSVQGGSRSTFKVIIAH